MPGLPLLCLRRDLTTRTAGTVALVMRNRRARRGGHTLIPTAQAARLLPGPGQACVGRRGPRRREAGGWGPHSRHRCVGPAPSELTVINMVLTVHADLSESKRCAGWGRRPAWRGSNRVMDSRVIKLTIAHLCGGCAPFLPTPVLYLRMWAAALVPRPGDWPTDEPQAPSEWAGQAGGVTKGPAGHTKPLCVRQAGQSQEDTQGGRGTAPHPPNSADGAGGAACTPEGGVSTGLSVLSR